MMTNAVEGSAAPLLLGRYRPYELLARGGSSRVFRAHDEQLGRDVAVKVFDTGDVRDFERYRDEVRMLASISHHGVIQIFDAGVDESVTADPRPFLVMELVRGVTLSSRLIEAPLAPRRAAEISFEIAEALEYVHAHGVVHRDVTPSNIMLVDYGTAASRVRARLMDFGIAIDGSTNHDPEAPAIGTAAYLSPEQVRREPLTPASDIYSLGLVMLEAFTRQRAFPGGAVESAVARLSADVPIPRGIDRAWRSLIEQMTQRDPAARPGAGAVGLQIRHVLRTTGRHAD